jgi:hypothetical protein
MAEKSVPYAKGQLYLTFYCVFLCLIQVTRHEDTLNFLQYISKPTSTVTFNPVLVLLSTISIFPPKQLTSPAQATSCSVYSHFLLALTSVMAYSKKKIQ